MKSLFIPHYEDLICVFYISVWLGSEIRLPNWKPHGVSIHVMISVPELNSYPAL